MKKSIKQHFSFAIISGILILGIFSVPIQVFAQTGSSSDSTELDEIDDERIDVLEEQLFLTLPKTTDNPNHIIVFNDPSDEGVFLDIDQQGFKNIESPYTLPSLGIGSHTLSFKFTDKEEAPRIIDREFIVTPRPALIDPAVVENKKVSLSGTALANSTIDILMIREAKAYRGKADTSSVGIWKYEFEDTLENGIYTVFAITNKDGFTSTYSEPLSFEVKDARSGASDKDIETGIKFSFSDIQTDKIQAIFSTNPDLGIFSTGVAAVGVVLGFIVGFISSAKTRKNADRIVSNMIKDSLPKASNLKGGAVVSLKDTPTQEVSKSKEEVQSIEKKIEAAKNDANGRKLTLREKFELAGLKTAAIDGAKPKAIVRESKNTPMKSNNQSERQKPKTKAENKNGGKASKGKTSTHEASKFKGKTMTREEFLKEYEDFDPDKPKERNIKITLTSGEGSDLDKPADKKKE